MTKEKTLNDYGRGRYTAFNQMISFIENEISKTKSRNPTPNTPQQIHNGARLKALNSILTKLKSNKENTEKDIKYKQ